MKTGPRGSPDCVPAAIRRLSRFPAASSRSRPSGTATAPFTCRRASQRPPLIVTAPSGTGRSRQAASGVGATGPGTVPCLVSAGDAGVMAVVTDPSSNGGGRTRTTEHDGGREEFGGHRQDGPLPTRHGAPRAAGPGLARPPPASAVRSAADDAKVISDLPQTRTIREGRQGPDQLVSRNTAAARFRKASGSFPER